MSVSVDGVVDYWRATTFKVADGKKGLLAVWFKPADVASTQALVAVQGPNEALTAFSLAVNSFAGLTLVARNSANAFVLLLVSSGLTLVAGRWYLALASWDLAAGTAKLYVNDVDVSGTPTVVNDTIDYTREWWVAASNNGLGVATAFFEGDLDYVYFATSSLDLSVEANRRLFYGPSGEQIGLGAGAVKPLSGLRPELFLAGGAGNFGRNLGTGGDLASFGSPGTSAGRPPAVETLSRGFRGELWRESQRSGIPFPESELVRESATGLEVARREFSSDRDEERRRRHYRRDTR